MLIFDFNYLGVEHRIPMSGSFGTILAVGATSMIFWQVFINIAMTMGLMPIVGVTLPFISYGGSSVLTTMICVGLLMNVSMRRSLGE